MNLLQAPVLNEPYTKIEFIYTDDSEGQIPGFKGLIEIESQLWTFEALCYGTVVWVTIDGVRYPNFQEDDELSNPFNLVMEKDPFYNLPLDQRIWYSCLQIANSLPWLAQPRHRVSICLGKNSD